MEQNKFLYCSLQTCISRFGWCILQFHCFTFYYVNEIAQNLNRGNSIDFGEFGESHMLGFSQTRQSWQYWHQRLFNVKTKNSSNKMLPPVRIEHGTSDFKSDTLLSELTWHVLLRWSLKCVLFMYHFTIWTQMNHLESIEHDYVRI